MDAIKIYELINEKMKWTPSYFKINEDDRKDLIQDTFINVYKKLEDNNLDLSNIENYIFIACKNNVLKYLKTNKRVKGEHITIENVYNLPQQIYNEPFLNETNERLKKYLFDNITFEFEREVFELRLQGYKISEICKKLNITNKQYERIIKSNINYIQKSLEEKKNKRTRRLIYYLEDENGCIEKYNKKSDVASFFRIDARRLKKIFEEGSFRNYKISVEWDINKLNKK